MDEEKQKIAYVFLNILVVAHRIIEEFVDYEHSKIYKKYNAQVQQIRESGLQTEIHSHILQEDGD